MRKGQLAIVFIIFVLPLYGCFGPPDSEPNDNPRITVTADSVSVTRGDGVTFQVETSDDDGTVTSVGCDFDGDGAYETDVTGQASVLHSFDTPGTYEVTCLATDDGGDTGVSEPLAITVGYIVGDVAQAYSYPDGIGYISDMTYDASSNSFWALGFTDSSCNGGEFLQLDLDNGTIMQEIALVDPPSFLNCSSEIVVANQFIYATSYGTLSGSPQSLIYKLNMSGDLVDTLACPATSTGYCEGLAWDGTQLWSGASDNMDIVGFSADGTINTTLPNVFDTAGITDISYDTSTGELIVIKDYVYRISPSEGGILETINAGFLGAGDWNGVLWWTLDNAVFEMDGIYIGN